MTSSFTATHTVAQALQHARQLGLDRLDAQWLLGAVLQQGPSWLMAHDDATLSPAQQVQWLGWLHRRAAGEPLAYILGDKAFFGLTLAVSPAVLIPRPDTETLVEWALDVLANGFPLPAAGHASPTDAPTLPPRRPRVLDLGTGSGAIALAIQHQRPDADTTAVDASEPALHVAQANARRLGLTVRFLYGNWLAPLAATAEQFDLIVSNPPYIAEGDPHMAALGHEPAQALTSGPDGLDDLRHIIAAAPAHLHPGGWLLLEHGFDQAVAVSQLLINQSFNNVSTRFDLGGQPRCTGGQWRPVNPT